MRTFLSVLFLSVLVTGCCTAPAQYRSVQLVKVCDQSGWNCQNVAVTVPYGSTVTPVGTPQPVVVAQPTVSPLTTFAVIGGLYLLTRDNPHHRH